MKGRTTTWLIWQTSLQRAIELTAGRDGRKDERAVFEKNEATFAESIDQLDRALTVMAKNSGGSLCLCFICKPNLRCREAKGNPHSRF